MSSSRIRFAISVTGVRGSTHVTPLCMTSLIFMLIPSRRQIQEYRAKQRYGLFALSFNDVN